MEPGKCPKCETPVTDVNAVECTITSATRSVKGMSFTCAACHTVLSVSIDPSIMRNQIAAAVKQLMG